jgi:hypothetical protein
MDPSLRHLMKYAPASDLGIALTLPLICPKRMDGCTDVRDEFPQKDFIGHRPLWEPMPKSRTGSIPFSVKRKTVKQF